MLSTLNRHTSNKQDMVLDAARATTLGYRCCPEPFIERGKAPMVAHLENMRTSIAMQGNAVARAIEQN